MALKDWQKIRKFRDDITQYCLHLTMNFDTLKEILKCGYLKPGFGERVSRIVGGKSKTIEGPNPAVCFTEQPLWCLAKTIKALGYGRYKPYGVALRKKFLYNYGGRPVIYGDKDLLKILPEEYQYLWVRYDPNYEVYGYPIDWTHEREWRCLVQNQLYLNDGRFITRVSWNIEGMPVLLPEDYKKILKDQCVPSFIVLVRFKEEIPELKNFLSSLKQPTGLNKLQRAYFKYLPKAKIVAFEEIKENLERSNQAWSRFETLPKESI